MEYCFQCDEYPCPKYKHMDDFDSFMTHQGRKSDMERIRQLGIEAYNAEQVEKTKILDVLLSGFHDGRNKTLFCTAVTLLDLQELREVLWQIENRSNLETLTLKEKSTFAAWLLKAAAAKNNIELKLRKKK